MKAILFLFLLNTIFLPSTHAFGLIDEADAQHIDGPSDGKHRGDRRQKRKQMMKQLNLTQEQQEQFRSIRQGNKEKMKSKREEVRTLKDSLQALMKSDGKGDSFRKNIMQKFDELQIKKNEMQRNRIEMALDIREILNPEQFEKFRMLRQSHKGKGKGRGKGRRGQRGNHSNGRR